MMNRWILTTLTLVLTVPTARAHFIWIVPDAKSGSVQMVFSDAPEPDDPKLLPKIAKTEIFLHETNREGEAVEFTQKDNAYVEKSPGYGRRTFTGVCCYGVSQHGDSAPFLLNYYAKTHVTNAGLAQSKDLPLMPIARLLLEIVPSKEAGRFLVLWQGKPLAEAEVVILAPGAKKGTTVKTDKEGVFPLDASSAGAYGLRARHVVAKEGEHDGKKYKEIRYYSTFVVKGNGTKVEGGEKEKPKADPAASKLLADARAARVLWKDFPGFTADIEVNLDGVVSQGQVEVESSGKVHYKGLEKKAEMWVKGVLGSTIGHRLDTTLRDTPCAFADDVTHHPMGRLIRVLNDEMHSGYRIKDDQILVVDRFMGEQKFTISVLENRKNKDGKYLPVSFVVDYWDPVSGELLHTDANYQSWKRVGNFDLPVVAKIVTAAKVDVKGEGWKNTPSTKSFTLSNHKLMEVTK